MKAEDIQQHIVKGKLVIINCRNPKLHNAFGQIEDVYSDHFIFKEILNASEYVNKREAAITVLRDVYVSEIQNISWM